MSRAEGVLLDTVRTTPDTFGRSHEDVPAAALRESMVRTKLTPRGGGRHHDGTRPPDGGEDEPGVAAPEAPDTASTAARGARSCWSGSVPVGKD